MSWVAWLDRRFYPGVQANWDDRLLREVVLSELGAGGRLLDVGAGAGIVEAMDFRAAAYAVCGVDPDPRVLQNPFLDEAVVGVIEALPYPDSSFDVVVADNVLEHLENPSCAFAEVARVLKPGGAFVFKTPNRFHYVAIIARFTPHAFHRWLNGKRGRAHSDTFPTLYRANSVSTIKGLADEADLRVERLESLEGRPEYLRFNVLTYLPGIAFERLVNLTDRFRAARVLIVGVARRP